MNRECYIKYKNNVKQSQQRHSLIDITSAYDKKGGAQKTTIISAYDKKGGAQKTTIIRAYDKKGGAKKRLLIKQTWM